MRQVIKRFLRHLDLEKNASPSTIESYRYDLSKFDDYLVRRLGKRFLPGDVFRDHIRDYLMWLSEVGHKSQTAHRLVRGHSQPSGYFSNMPIVQDY
jgi:site-specific recombinase XerD